MKRGNHLLTGFSILFTAVLLLFDFDSVSAAEVPSAQNTDGGSISLDFVHHQAQSLTLSLDNEHLDFQDVTVNYTDPVTGEPLCISLLADPGTSAYTLYEFTEPVTELNGSLNISMITEPGYRLDSGKASFTIDGQTFQSGSLAVFDSPSVSVRSSSPCVRMETSEVPDEPETPVQPEPTAVPDNPAQPEPTAAPDHPTQPEPTAAPDHPTQPEPTAAPDHPAQPEPTAVPETPIHPALTAAPETPAVPESPVSAASGQTSLSTIPYENQIGSPDTAPAEILSTVPVDRPSALTTSESAPESRREMTSITRLINLILSVLALVLLILLLCRLLLTLQREKRNHQYRRYHYHS